MGKDRKSLDNLSTADVVPLSLDDWQVEPIALDDWSVTGDEPSDAANLESPEALLKSTAEPEPIVQAISLDDWEDPEPVSLEAWSVSESEMVEVDLSTEEDLNPDFISEEEPLFEALDLEAEEQKHPVLPEVVDLESEALQEDCNLPEDSFSGHVSDFVTQPELEIDEPSLELDTAAEIDDSEIKISENSDNKDIFDPEESIGGESFALDFEESIESLEESVEVSENIFEESPEEAAISITPTQTRTVEVKFSEKDLMEGTGFRDLSAETESPMITSEEDLGLDIDDLDLPGTELKTVTGFGPPREESIDFNIHDDDDEGDGFFDLKTVATMIESHETLELDTPPPHGELPPSEVLDLSASEEPLEQSQTEALIAKENIHIQEHLHAEELAEEIETPVALAVGDLAQEHQLPVIALSSQDLRENNHLAVICLSENDLASNHRVVVELEDEFFEAHDIQRNSLGIILLKACDLAPVDVQETSTATTAKTKIERTRKVKTPSGKSNWDDKKLIKACLVASTLFILGSIIGFHFKYSWTTVSEEQYEELKATSSAFDWYYSGMFKYRTKDSAWRWYGQQKLRASQYEKASEASNFSWLFYFNSGRENIGDRLEE
jgi:hypothetical protein